MPIGLPMTTGLKITASTVLGFRTTFVLSGVTFYKSKVKSTCTVCSDCDFSSKIALAILRVYTTYFKSLASRIGSFKAASISYSLLSTAGRVL